MPDTITIIRHAEKPLAKNRAPFGVTAEGEENFKSLTVKGWQRAGALAVLFAHGSSAIGLRRPTLIYASSPSGPSRRPIETIMPLAAKLHITPNVSFTKGDEAALAADVLTQDGHVLICWQHEQIPVLAKYLTGQDAVDRPVPALWPDDGYDDVWSFSRDNDGSWRFTLLAQNIFHHGSETGR